jgi:fibronectin type 3 domain-containing protein
VTLLAGPDSVEVSWERSPEPDTKGFYIYRSTDGSPFERKGDLVSIPAFSDKDVQRGKKYRYEISAIDERGNESAHSQAVEITF